MHHGQGLTGLNRGLKSSQGYTHSKTQALKTRKENQNVPPVLSLIDSAAEGKCSSVYGSVPITTLSSSLTLVRNKKVDPTFGNLGLVEGSRDPVSSGQA